MRTESYMEFATSLLTEEAQAQRSKRQACRRMDILKKIYDRSKKIALISLQYSKIVEPAEVIFRKLSRILPNAISFVNLTSLPIKDG